MTNGEKIKEIFPKANIKYHKATELVDEHITVIIDDCDTCQDYSLDWWNAEYKEPTTKNDLGVACIDRAELLKAMDTWDKFGYSTRYGLERLDKDDKGFVPYVKYDDMVNCVKGLPSVTPQEPRKGHWITRPHIYGVAFCSECGFELKINNTNYCPNCRADMREVEE